MEIPKNIKIGVYIFEVVQGHRFENPDRWGETSYKAQKIYLADFLHGQNLEQTFLHEVRHIIANIYNGVESNGKEEEQENERMSQGWYQVLTENDMLK